MDFDSIGHRPYYQSLEDKCHGMLNAVEPGTVAPIHRHPTRDESFVILRFLEKIKLILKILGILKAMLVGENPR